MTNVYRTNPTYSTSVKPLRGSLSLTLARKSMFETQTSWKLRHFDRFNPFFIKTFFVLGQTSERWTGGLHSRRRCLEPKNCLRVNPKSKEKKKKHHHHRLLFRQTKVRRIKRRRRKKNTLNKIKTIDDGMNRLITTSVNPFMKSNCFIIFFMGGASTLWGPQRGAFV